MVFKCGVLLLFLNVFCQPHSQSNDQLSETQQNTSKSHNAANTQKISQKAKSIKTAVKNITSPSSSTMLSGKVAMWKTIHIVSIVVTVLWKQHWAICRGTSIDVRCVVKAFCRQRMKIVSCRTQTDAQSVDVCLWLIFETILLLLEHRDIHLNMFPVFLQRCLIILTRRWFWTSSGIPACWKQSRFDAPASLSGELFRTSARGLYPLRCAITHKHCSTKNVRPQNKRRVISVLEIQTLKKSNQTLHLCFYFFRYKVLMRGLLDSEDPRGCCVQLLCQYDSSSAEWQLGKTKVSNTLHLLLCSLVQNIQKECKPGFSLLPHFIAGLSCTRSGAGSS